MSLSCVSREQMKAFLVGTLTSEEEAELTAHMECCSDCERLAAELSDDEETREIAVASRKRPAVPPVDPEMDDLRRRLHALGLFEMALSGDSASQIGGHVDTHVSPDPREGEAGSTANEGLAWKTVEFGDDALGQRRLAQVGPYEMIRPLGAGSFGIVYLALDRRLNRRVAIKVARASVLTDPGLRARFFREAEALARLEHPHIVPVYEADEIDGLCFLALAYCEGPTLEQWFQERDAPLEPRVAARLVLPLVLAVEHAHSRGILHRDIKPGNILLQTSDAGSRKSEIRSQRSEVRSQKSEIGQASAPTSDLRPPTSGPRPPISDLSPKLTDFGLARLMEEKHGETLAGVVLGTAHYMAPEQAAGHIERVGPATDVYSLGAILYQLISGRVPIEGNSTIDTLRRVLIDEPTELNRLVVDVPDDLGAIVRKCLQKNPSQRYGTAAALADDLQRFLSGRPTTARPLAPAERFSRWLARHKALVPLLSLAATAVGLSVGLFWYAERLSRSQSLFREAKEQLGQANERAESRALFLAEQAYATDLFAAGKSTSKGDIAHAIEALRRQLPADGRPDLRGLEWYYLWALNNHEPQVFTDAGNQVYHLRLSPDGKELAAAGNRGLLRLYDADRLTLRVVIQTGQVEVNGIDYSPDGHLAATAGDDGTIRVFDLATRAEKLKIPAHADKAFAVLFYDGQNKLASCGKEPVIRLWDAKSGEPLGTLEGHTAQVESIALSPRGDLLASASADKTAVLWNLARRKPARTLSAHRGPVMGVCFSPDGRWVATGSRDNTIVLWDLRTGRKIDAVAILDEVQSIAFSSDGGRLYAGDRSGSVHQYRVGARTPEDRRARLEPVSDEKAWHAHDTRIWCVAAGRDQTFYTAGEDHYLRRWDRSTLSGLDRAEATIPTPPGDMFVDLDFSPDGKLLFALREASGITAYDADTLRPQVTLHCRHSRWRALKVLAGRDEIAAGNAHGALAIWNYKTGELKRLIAPAGEDFSVLELAWSPLSGLLAVSAYDLDEVRIYQANNGELVARLPTTNHTAIALSPDGRHLAVDSLDNIALFDVAAQRPLLALSGHTATITSLAFSADGKLLASGSVDRTARLWTVEGARLATLTGHLADVMEVGFTPDGRTLISLDDRGAAQITHVATRQTLFDLPMPAERLRAMAISPDARRLAMIRTLRNTHEVVVLGAAAGR